MELNEQRLSKLAGLLTEEQTIKGVTDDFKQYLTDEKAIEAFMKKKYKNIESVKTSVSGNIVKITVSFEDGWKIMGPGGEAVFELDIHPYRTYRNRTY